MWKPLEARNGSSLMESKEMESQGYNHKELNSADNPMNRKQILA